MKYITTFLLLLLLTSCSKQAEPTPGEMETSEAEEENSMSNKETIEENSEPTETEKNEDMNPEKDVEELKKEIIAKYSERIPNSWGEYVEGVVTHIDTEEKIVVLTFDACDGSPNSYDAELINFLSEADIPATLFIGGQWIEAYEEEFITLAENPLFEIANHGYLHKPLSVNGQEAYSIPGTANVSEVFDEIYTNQLQIQKLTGESPKYFRAGTAYYDEVAVEIAQELGVKVVNYNQLGDAGGTFTHEQIVSQLDAAQPGAIYLFHMNQPQSAIASGVKEGIQHLQEQGYTFVRLKEIDHLLK